MCLKLVHFYPCTVLLLAQFLRFHIFLRHCYNILIRISNLVPTGYQSFTNFTKSSLFNYLIRRPITVQGCYDFHVFIIFVSLNNLFSCNMVYLWKKTIYDTMMDISLK